MNLATAKLSVWFYFKTWQYRAKKTGSIVIMFLKNKNKTNYQSQKQNGSKVNYQSFAILIETIKYLVQ
jgi:hypothetical protein